MQHAHTLVFVEVRYRRSPGFGGALESITPAKQQRIMQAAQRYLQQHEHWQEHDCRFDVIAIHGTPGQPGSLEWLQHAFVP